MTIRKISRVTVLLLATFLLALPLSPARALATPNVAITQSNAADPGGSFTASLTASGTVNLGAMDVELSYNPNVLTVTSAPCAKATCPSLVSTVWNTGAPLLVVRHDIFPSIGLIRYALTFVGGFDVSPPGPASILDINFVVNNPPGMTATDLPSKVSIDTITLVEENGGPQSVIPTTTNLSYSPPPYLVLQSVGCRATNPGFNVNAKGFTDGLFCRVINSGSVSIQAIAVFTFQSLNGVTGSVQSLPVTLAPGQFAILSTTITVPNAADVFIINGTPTRVIAMPDGTFAMILGQSVPLFINVNLG